jgi:ABC-type transport system substrate-binding protein
MSLDPDPLDKDLRRVMRERWDRQPIPHDLSASVRSRFGQTSMRQTFARFASAAAGLALLAALAVFFAAVLDRRPGQPAVTQIIVTDAVTEVQTTPVTEIVPVTVEARAQFVIPHSILSEVRVRQAIAHCTDRAALVKSVYPWVEDAAPFLADSFVPRDHWAYAEEIARYPFDPAQGAALLDEAGWTLLEGATYRANANGDELALTLTTTNAQFRQTWAALWETQMQACGIRIVRFHTPGEWLFGDSTGLRRRDFEVAAFAWVAEGDPGGRTLYACDSIPNPANGWQGQNYTGWCNEAADAAIRTATTALDREARRAAYAAVQRAWTQDAPALPLFFRPNSFAINAALENFKVDGSQWLHTWNAGEWRIPGRDTIIIGEDAEPATLARLDTAYVSQVLRQLIAGADYTRFGYDYQPVLLTRIPTFESGAAVSESVEVSAGAAVVDALGEAAELRPGLRVRNANGDEVEFTLATPALILRQVTVTYEFVPGLTWPDGAPVVRADYELAYRIECDPETGAREFLAANPRCAQIANVEFLGDTAYRVTYKPGFADPEYVLPPFGREPAHRVIRDGRRLADVPGAEWNSLREVAAEPWGVGPYRIVEWVYGREMRLEANPHFYAGPVATPNITVRFMEHDAAISALIAGAVDVLDAETLVAAEELMPLVEAQRAGQPVRVIAPPSPTWEHLDFALFQR